MLLNKYIENAATVVFCLDPWTVVLTVKLRVRFRAKQKNDLSKVKWLRQATNEYVSTSDDVFGCSSVYEGQYMKYPLVLKWLSICWGG